MERKKAKNVKQSYLKIFILFSFGKKKIIVCMCKVLRLDKSNKVIQLTVTIKDVPRDNSD